MKLFKLFLALSLVGCASSPTFNQDSKVPLKLEAPSTVPIPRKVFSGPDWQVSVEDNGWTRNTDADNALVVINVSQRIVVFLDRESAVDLDSYATKQEADFRDEIEFHKESVLVSGFNGYKYTMSTARQTMWSWATVTNGKGYFLSCGTSTARAKVNQEVCEDVMKHFLVLNK